MADLNTLQFWLIPYAQGLYELGKVWAHEDGEVLVVTSARRSYSKQYELWANWQRGKSQIPAAPPGKSMHQFGLAFDMAHLGIDPFEDRVLWALGYVWVAWGGRYGGWDRDPVHFESGPG